MSHHGHGSCLSKASVNKLIIQLDTSYEGLLNEMKGYFPFCSDRKNKMHSPIAYKVQMLHIWLAQRVYCS